MKVQTVKSIALALASFMAVGAYAAPSAKSANAKKKNLKSQRMASSSLKKKSQVQDAIRTNSSSATSTATTPAISAGTSSTQASAVGAKKKSFVDGIRAQIGFEYYGSSISDPLNGWQTDKQSGYGIGSDPAQLDTRLTLGYQMTDNLRVAYNAYFNSYASIVDENGKIDKEGKTFGFSPNLSYLQLSVGKFVQAGKFKWNGDFRFYPGLGAGGNQLPLYFRSGQNLSYSLTPRLNLAAYNTIRYYHRTNSAYNLSNDADGKKTDFRFTLGPTVEYQFADAVGSYLALNMDFSRSHATGAWNTSEYYRGADLGHYFELGGSIDLTKNVNLNPYIDSFLRKMTVDGAQFGANLNINVL